MEKFRKELQNLINRNSLENGSDTPDFVLAEYLTDCLKIFDKATRARKKFWRDDHEKEKSVETLGDGKVGIGTERPTKKLDIVGFSKFDTFLIRITTWIFRKRKLTISVIRKTELNIDPNSTLFVDGNVGIGT